MPNEKIIEETVKTMRMKTSELIDALDECKMGDRPCSTIIMKELEIREVYRDLMSKLEYLTGEAKETEETIDRLETRVYNIECRMERQ